MNLQVDEGNWMEEGEHEADFDEQLGANSAPISRKGEEISFLAGEACLYSVIRRSALSLGWKLVGEDSSERAKRSCHVIWVDRSFVNDKLFLSIQPWQRINHFPGMTNICRKARLAQSLEIMRKRFPREFSFYPATYILPQGIAAFRALFAPNGHSRSTYIVKPDGAAQGKGIFLTRRIEDVENLSAVCVAQQYIRNPLLIDKKKFDLRIYVLVTSCSPLRMYLFRDGLVRICTEEYKRPNTSNMDDRCMHLTNYSVNKRSDKYERDEKGSAPSNLGSKRSISWLMTWLSGEKGETAAKNMWSKIGDICVMTIISILPILRREYASIFTKRVAQQNSNQDADESSDDCQASKPLQDDSNGDSISGRSRCFEILGFDIMVDKDLRPSLIEVNHLPSWGTDSPIDEDIKSRVITQALSAINVNAQDKRSYESAKRRQSQMRLRRRQTVTCSDDIGSNQMKGGNGFGVKRQPLFDSKSAERRIRLVYEKHAPEKLSKVKDLLSRYRGYEEWLAKKVEEKYNQNDDESSTCSNDSDSLSDDESVYFLDEIERKKIEEEERILLDYDRIYPPSSTGSISLSRYREMEKFVTEMDEKQQQRLTCPLQQMRQNGEVESEFNTRGQLNRGDGWIGGNIHIRSAKEEAKILGPPTKKQIEFADKLSRGYSVEDTEVSEKSVKKKSRILHHDFIYEEENPFYHLIDRVRESREQSKKARKRAEIKLSKRSSKLGAPLKQQVMKLGLEVPLEMQWNSKFYTKRTGFEDFPS
ncbi:hypothetical protein ACHAWF_007319 [Thalassiosira exigua]